MREQPPIEQTPILSVPESLETLNERIEVLRGVIEEFSTEVGPALKEYENTSGVVFKSGENYNDDLQRRNLLALTTKLAVFESHVEAIFKLFDKVDGGSGLNHILTAVRRVQEVLINAPDARYTHEAMAETYGGEKNIPAGKYDFQDTQKSIETLKDQIRGIQVALTFLHPTKVL